MKVGNNGGNIEQRKCQTRRGGGRKESHGKRNDQIAEGINGFACRNFGENLQLFAKS